MKIIQRITLAIISVILASAALMQGASAAGGSITVSGFSFSESVIHDPYNDRYIVSNAGNPPTGPAAPGYISTVKPNGQVTNYKWIDGASASTPLDDPLGMAIFAHKLYVADINKVRVFNVFTGQHITDIAIPGVTGLNDVASYWGGVFVSDPGLDFSTGTPTGTAAVYKINGLNNAVSTLVAGPQLAFPNGLLYDPGKGLLIGSVASATVQKANVFTGSLSNFATLPSVGVDGIAKVGSSYYFSNPTIGTIYKVDGQGVVTTEDTGLVFPTDIGSDNFRNKLLIPQLPIGTVIIKQL